MTKAARSAVLLALAALCLAACGRPQMGAATGRYSCTGTYGGKTGYCMVLAGVSDTNTLARTRQACEIAPEQRFGEACPSDGLIGCCATRGPGGSSEVCVYRDGALVDDPGKCAAHGGVWSDAP